MSETTYERFTDRARKVLQLANQEVQRFNHEYIGTEHILLGLVKEDTSVAANVLKTFDIDLRKIRLEVEKIVQAGLDMVTMGKLPQTPSAKRVLEYSIEEARSLDHNYVGTAHLLLGLLREQEGVAAQVFANLGVAVEDVREAILLLHPTKPYAPHYRFEVIRDQFAMSMMSAWIIKNGFPTSNESARQSLARCYELADAAMKVREV